MYFLYKIGEFLATTLPIRISYHIADFIGSLYYLLAKKDKKIASNNLKVVLSHPENPWRINKVPRMIFVNFSRYLLEFFHSPRINKEYIKRHIKIRGKENLDKALSLGKGLLIVSAHLGNWELGAIVLSILGYKMNIVAWTHKDKRVNNFFLRRRKNKGVKAIPLGTGIRQVFSALKANEIVALLGDIDYLNPEMGIKVNFFGQDTIMPKGPAALSLKASCPVVTVFVIREDCNKFEVFIEEPIVYQPTKDNEEDLILLTKMITAKIEKYISRYPEQWFMLTPRWQKNLATEEIPS